MNFHKHLTASILIFLLIVSFGSYAYHTVEGWNALDSVYFVVITITTIGYGDLVPVTDIGKVFTIFFSFFGIAMALYFLSLISSNVFKKHLSSKVGQIKQETKKQEGIKLNKKSKKKKK